jgi:hypothetical protein
MKNFAMLGLVLGLATLFVGCAPEKPKEKRITPSPSVTTPADTKVETDVYKPVEPTTMPVEPAVPGEGDKKAEGDKPFDPIMPAEGDKKVDDKPLEPATPAAPEGEKKAEVPLDPAPAK